ncbi:unnamed protein product [Alopecurus aequalis]
MAPRRSSLLQPQIHTTEQGRRDPQIQPIADGAGVTSRPLRPHFQASEEVGAGMARRIRTGTSATSLPDDGDMLREILLRLPPQPSSLPRASAVCKRWRGLVTDPKFHRQFCAHHGKPPLLGLFQHTNQGIVFTPTLDPPDRVPPQRFHLGGYLLDCHHGLVLISDIKRKELLVCNLITRVQRRVAFPPEFRKSVFQGAVLCAADHLHGSCHSSPFKVVLVSIHNPHRRPLTYVYSSETGLWGNLISIDATCRVTNKPVVLLGNCLYWFSFDGILEFDLADNSLTLIGMHLVINDIHYDQNCQIIEAQDGALGLAILSYPRFRLWQRNVNAHGVATWMPWKTIEIPGPPPQIEGETAWLLGHDHDTDTIFLHVSGNVYGVQLKLMQSRKLYETNYLSRYLPFNSFYTTGDCLSLVLLL